MEVYEMLLFTATWRTFAWLSGSWTDWFLCNC